MQPNWMPRDLPKENPKNDDSRKGAKDAKFGESSKNSLFAGLASWRENPCFSRSVEHFIGKGLGLIRYMMLVRPRASVKKAPKTATYSYTAGEKDFC